MVLQLRAPVGRGQSIFFHSYIINDKSQLATPRPCPTKRAAYVTGKRRFISPYAVQLPLKRFKARLGIFCITVMDYYNYYEPQRGRSAVS